MRQPLIDHNKSLNYPYFPFQKFTLLFKAVLLLWLAESLCSAQKCQRTLYFNMLQFFKEFPCHHSQQYNLQGYLRAPQRTAVWHLAPPLSSSVTTIYALLHVLALDISTLLQTHASLTCIRSSTCRPYFAFLNKRIGQATAVLAVHKVVPQIAFGGFPCRCLA